MPDVTANAAAAADTARRKAATPRLAGLDAGRLLAAAAVVWIHSLGINPHHAWLSDAGRFAVPFFAFAATALIGESFRRAHAAVRRTPFPHYAAARFLRIYVPFAVWSLLYFLLRDAKHLLHPAASPAITLDLSVFLVGTAHHLWFLPFIFLITLAAYPLAKLLIRKGPLARGLAVLLLLAGIAACIVPSPVSYDDAASGAWNHAKYALGLGWNALPAACWGLAVIPLFPRLQTLFQRSRMLGIPALAFSAAAMVFDMRYGDHMPLSNIAGVAFFFAAIAMPSAPLIALLARGGKFAYSIYLVHVAILLAFDTALIRNRDTVSTLFLVVLFALTFALSLMVSWLATKSRLLRWAFP
mgnify:CR=1 FL=1